MQVRISYLPAKVGFPGCISTDKMASKFEILFPFVDALKNKQNIQKLVIDANQFGAEGCGRIMKKMTDMKKRHVLEEIEEDEEPDDEEEEEIDPDGDSEDVQNLTSFNFASTGEYIV